MLSSPLHERVAYFTSYDDFCERVDKRTVHKGVQAALVSAGAFDSLHSRVDLLGELEISEPDILVLEHKALGIYISGHPLDGYEYGAAHPLSEVAELEVGDEFRTIGLVAELKEHTDKNGGHMAFVTLEDRADRMEVTIFASVYRGDLEVGTCIHLSGRLDEPLKAVTIEYETVDLTAVVAVS